MLNYSYDGAGNRTVVQTTSPAVPQTIERTDYSFDFLNRLETVIDNQGNLTTYGYDNVGNRSSVSYANGSSEVYSYDSLNRLTRKETFDGSGALVQSYDYTLHPTGRRTQIDELSGRSTSYTFDDLYRLTAETITDSANGNYSASYQYDAVGNRIEEVVQGVTTAFTYDDNDRLTQTGGTTYTHDANGNTLTETLDGTTKTYVYNSLNQLIRTTAMEGGSADGIDYQYNVDGIRTQQDDGTTTTTYIVDSNRDYAQVLAELTDNVQNVTYVYGDDLISQTRTEGTFFYHYDGLGSTRGLTDAAGSLTDTWDYAAFGEILHRTGSTDNSYLFTGEQFDPNLNQYYLRARYYDQGIGRFTQMDTWMGRNHDPITLHKYLYAHADPANYIDPTGNAGVASFLRGQAIVLDFLSKAHAAHTVFSVATGEKEFSAKEFGTAIVLNMLGGAAGKFVGLLGKKIAQTCNSFDGATLVATEFGLVPISEIKIGDRVWAYNEETEEKSLQEVVHLIQGEGLKELVDIKLISGEIITATAEHPFFLPEQNQWMDAGELLQGNSLLTLLGTSIAIESIVPYEKQAAVYNLTVNNDHTYYVGEQGVLSHNTTVCKLPFFGTSARNHILRGDISPSGKITGYHHRFGGTDGGPLKLLKVTKKGKGAKGGSGGIYEAEVGFVDANGVLHKKTSTFFPDNWTSGRVMGEVNGALLQALGKNGVGGGTQKLIGKSPSGIDIQIIVKNGEVQSAWPILK